MAFSALMANKMRSLLTMLGIIIGVGAVIAMVSIGMGVRNNIQQSIASLGSNMLIVMPGAENRTGVRGGAGSKTTLEDEDADAIKAKIGGIDNVSAMVSGSYQVVFGNSNWKTSVQGVSPDYMDIRSLEVESGIFITEHDMVKRNRVAVIGSTVSENLFGGSNPVGQNIRIDNQPFKIIGVLKKKGWARIRTM